MRSSLLRNSQKCDRWRLNIRSRPIGQMHQLLFVVETLLVKTEKATLGIAWIAQTENLNELVQLPDCFTHLSVGFKILNSTLLLATYSDNNW